MSEKRWEEMRRVSAEHALKPEAGDYWHDMFCPVLYVRDVTDDYVVYFEPDRKNNIWAKVPQIKTREAFDKYLHYSSDYELGTWAECVPRAYKKYCKTAVA